MSSTASSFSTLPHVNRNSMILSGPYGPRKSGKMDAIFTLLKECGKTVIVDLTRPLSSSMASKTTHQMIAEYQNTDVVVCDNVPSVDHLREFLNLHALIGKQFILSTDLGAEQLMPLAKELASHKFDVHFTSTWPERSLPSGLPEDYSRIQRQFAEQLLVPTILDAPKPLSLSTGFCRNSLILSGPSGSGKTTKIRNAFELADDAGLKVGHLHTGMQLSSKMLSPTQEGILQLQLQRVDVIVCDDNRITGTVEGLRDFLTSIQSITQIQFILATTLTVDQVTMAGGASWSFDFVATSTADFVDDSKPYGRGWACRHFLSRQSSSPISPIPLPIIAPAQDMKSEEKKNDERKCESTVPASFASFTSVLFIEYGCEDGEKGAECIDRLDELEDYAHLAGLKTLSLNPRDIDRNSKFEVSNANVDVICCRGLRKMKDVYHLLDKYNGDVRQFFITADIDPNDSTGFRSELEKRNCTMVFNRNLGYKFSAEVANYEKLVSKIKCEWKASIIKDAKEVKSTQVDKSTKSAFVNQRSLLLIGPNDSFKSGKLKELISLAKKCKRNVIVVDSKQLEKEETFTGTNGIFCSNMVDGRDIIVCMDLESTDHLYAATKLKLPGQQIFVGSRTFSHFELMKNAFGKRGFDCYEQKLLTVLECDSLTQMFGSRAESTMTALGNVDWAINWASRECQPNQPQK